jgi:putative hydrolase of the HAD superfamily
VIFDLGGTLVDWPEWEEAVERWWVLSYNYLVAARPDVAWPGCGYTSLTVYL